MTQNTTKKEEKAIKVVDQILKWADEEDADNEEQAGRNKEIIEKERSKREGGKTNSK